MNFMDEDIQDSIQDKPSLLQKFGVRKPKSRDENMDKNNNILNPSLLQKEKYEITYQKEKVV